MPRSLIAMPSTQGSSPYAPGRKRSIALLLALGLAASACGSSATDAGEPAPTDAATTVGTDPTTSSGTGSGGTESTEAAPDDAASSEEADDGADASATLANYPSVDVVDLGSGETVNFAEQVAGGSLPTLIWFWAPH